MGCGGSKEETAADIQPIATPSPPAAPAVTPAKGALKSSADSKYDSNRSVGSNSSKGGGEKKAGGGVAFATPQLERQNQRSRVSFKAAIQQQLAIQAVASGSEEFAVRVRKVCGTAPTPARCSAGGAALVR